MPSLYQILAVCFAVSILHFSGVQSDVRQCSCKEQAKCLKDMKTMAMGCVDECWSITGQVTKNPQQLRKCFNQKNGEIEALIDCFQDRMKGCAANSNGPMIAPQSLDSIIAVAEKNIRAIAKQTLDSPLAGNMNHVVAVAEKFGECTKKCIIKNTAGGVCMKKYKCQPLMPNEAKVKQLMKQCNKFDFKAHAGPLCQCALNAGVKELSTYCPVLLLMGPQH